ncbi:MAG TPA: DNRLRE domain-containing protein [Acidimicrobiia bacterium]|nr:DNRLRE domain-containing protein [Acidimicrobiia bacterium]
MSLVRAGAVRRLRSLGSLTAALTAFGALHAVAPSPAHAAVLALPAVADAKVAEASPSTNLGTAASLEVDRRPETESLIAFSVPDPGGVVTQARLRLFVTDGSTSGPEVYRSEAAWSETAVTWDSRPARHERLDDVGSVKAGRYVEYDVTPAVTGAGMVSFYLVADSSDGTDFRTRENPDRGPELLLETAADNSTTTTTATTSTTTSSTTTSTTSPTSTSTTSTSSSTTSTTTSTSSTTTTTAPPPVPATGTIVTLAGVSAGFGGDGGPATAAWLRLPRTMAADPDGNVYIVDTYNHRIRKVDTNGIITTIGGTGSAGYSGDGGPATSARFDTPHGIAADPAGNVYVADPPNQRIRRIDAITGIVTTVAGNGDSGFSGDGGPATSAQIRYPKGVEIGPDGNLYIADNNNHRVRRVDLSTGVISTVAGSGSRGFSGDGGPATAARLDEPRNIAFDAQGRLYIVDQNNRRIRRVETDGTIRTFASGFTFPRDVAVDRNGTVYVADEDANRIRQVSASGVVSTFAGTGSSGLSGDGGPADLARLKGPLGVAYDAATHTVLIGDTRNDRIRAVRLPG